MLICSRIAVTALALAGAAILSASAQAQTGGAPSGRLNCNIGAALGPVVTAQRPMNCRYIPRRGPMQRYSATVRSFAIDLGTIKAASMSWRVYGPYARASLGALEGQYGVPAGSPQAGNPLIGGPDNEVRLLALPLQGSRGVNAAVGVTSVELKLRNASRR